MRERIRAKISKAVRCGRYGYPAFPSILKRLQREGLPVEQALRHIVADSNCTLNDRARAARLLQEILGDPAAFVPLLRELAAGGDAHVEDLTDAIVRMWHTNKLPRPAFEVLRDVMNRGTLEQRFWVVDKIALFEDPRVRRALLEVLDDSNAPATVRGNAANGLSRQISRETVQACMKAVSDPQAEVRFWAAFALGEAAVWNPFYRDTVIPVLERMLDDQAVAPGWWSVGREAQLRLAHARGSAAELHRLREEMEAIRNNPSASAEDKGWAAFNQ